MEKFESKIDLRAKVEWEGGIVAAIEYGIAAEELPDDAPPEVFRAWEELANTLPKCVDIIESWIYTIEGGDAE